MLQTKGEMEGRGRSVVNSADWESTWIKDACLLIRAVTLLTWPGLAIGATQIENEHWMESGRTDAKKERRLLGRLGVAGK